MCYFIQGWVQTVAAKQAYMHGVAQHRMGLVAQASKNFGETVARMKVSASVYRFRLAYVLFFSFFTEIHLLSG